MLNSRSGRPRRRTRRTINTRARTGRPTRKARRTKLLRRRERIALRTAPFANWIVYRRKRYRVWRTTESHERAVTWFEALDHTWAPREAHVALVTRTVHGTPVYIVAYRMLTPPKKRKR